MEKEIFNVFLMGKWENEDYNSDLSLSYDRETQTLSVSQTRMKAITKTGKTWKLKFAVTYKDKAGNEKDAVVTYKIIIK